MTDIQIGARLKELRKKAGKGQSEMAEALSITVAGYSAMERGASKLSVKRMLEICSFFAISPQRFFADGDDLSDLDRQEILSYVGSIIGPAHDIMDSLNKLAVIMQKVLKDASGLKLGLNNAGLKDKRSGGKYL
jgi:transcriptional regulator with XRE-family HTH domain